LIFYGDASPKHVCIENQLAAMGILRILPVLEQVKWFTAGMAPGMPVVGSNGLDLGREAERDDRRTARVVATRDEPGVAPIGRMTGGEAVGR